MNSSPSRLTILFYKIKNLFKKSSKDYRLTIGEVLKQRNIITDRQLQTALEVQREKLGKFGKAIRLGQIIVELGYATEEDLIEAINYDYHLSVASLNDDIKTLVNEKRRTLIEGLPGVRVPIWVQLFGTTLLIIVVTIFILSAVILNRQKERLYDQTVKTGLVSLKYFGSNARIGLLEDDIIKLNSLLKEATTVEGLRYAIIVDNNNIIKAHTDLKKINHVFNGFGSSGEKKHQGGVTYFNYSLPTGQETLNLTETVAFQSKKLGEVHVGLSIDFMQQMIRKEQLTILVITFFIVLIGILVAFLLGFRFSKPISKLVHATEEIGRGNYQHKIVLARNDELGNLATSFNRMGDELWKNAQMQKSFGKYVGSEVLDMIMANPEKTWLKGHRNEATIIFCDIRGFTSFSEEKEPEEIVEGLNQYFEIATKSVMNHGGYVDKFIGDAVLAVFGVPVYHDDHMARAVKAAVEMRQSFNKANLAGNLMLGSIGISINSGIVVSGNIGSQVKMEYTVIGDSVNVASRLNNLAKSGEIVVSKNIYEHLKQKLQVKPLPPQKIKGKSELVESFVILEYSDIIR
jgi:adenylate cyclase